MFMQSMHAFAIDTDLHFNTSINSYRLTHCCQIFSIMHKINSVCNGLKGLIDYVHADEDRVIGSSRMQSYIKPCMWKKKAH